MLKISFDFDGTLNLEQIEKLVSKLDHKFFDIYVITSRHKNAHSNHDLWDIVQKLGINIDNIFFLEGSYKWRKILELGINYHFDDVVEECQLILQHTKCIPILIWDYDNLALVKSDSFMKGIN